MVRIDDEYYISADEKQFKLVRKFKPTKAPVKGTAKDVSEEVVGYYATVAGAIMRYRREQMLKWVGSERLTLDKLCDLVNGLDAEIIKKLARLKELPVKEPAAKADRPAKEEPDRKERKTKE